MKALLLATVLVVLAACGLQGAAIRSAISKGGADAADQTLTDIEWYMCYAASIGSIKRKYGGDKAKAYSAICKDADSRDIVN